VRVPVPAHAGQQTHPPHPPTHAPRQILDPYTFPSAHARLLEPYNYYAFGQRYVSTLINFNDSFLGHAEIWDKVCARMGCVGCVGCACGCVRVFFWGGGAGSGGVWCCRSDHTRTQTHGAVD
jgi:hypothetical protein